MKEPSMKEKDKCVDSKLWHACAGGMVKMPTVNSMIYYFPQGHAEHAQGVVDFGTLRPMPPFIPCRVTAVKFMADNVNDEVFAKIQIAPIRVNDPDNSEDDGLQLGMKDIVTQEKPVSFAKTLTQSDANNGGGFSIPRYCAETIFPRLDYSADPPVQTVIAKDVHGEAWKFRHIYRGTPRRHLLTTGWSNFVNQKKLVAGDSIVFLRAENGDLCIGIRRAKTAGVGYSPETRAGWNLPCGSGRSSYGSFSVFLREEESKLMRGNFGSDGSMRGRSRVRADSVIEAANHAANCQPFEIVYYPRGGTPEFFVNTGEVKAAIRIQWCPGMRYKMAFETEDSSRISWFMGTISSVQVADPVRWPSSPWRLLQVTWDEPDILQNVKRVNPWLVELVSSMPTIHLAHLSPPRKRPRFSQNPDFPFEAQFQSSVVPRNHLFPRDSLFSCFSDSPSAGIQGARHTQFGVSLQNLQLNKMQTSLFHPRIHQLDHATPSSRISAGVSSGNPTIQDSLSCFGHPSESLTKSCDDKSPQLMLFGQPILTEQQVFLSKLENKICHGATVNNSSEGNLKKQVNKFDGLVSAVIQKTSLVAFPFHDDHRTLELDIGTGLCKVFMESDDVGRTLNLSDFGSYEELYRKLADMFGIKESRMMSHVLYKDAAGAIKQTGDEPFRDFMKTARRLTILTDSRSDNLAR